jgi:hypothetical protein
MLLLEAPSRLSMYTSYLLNRGGVYPTFASHRREQPHDTTGTDARSRDGMSPSRGGVLSTLSQEQRGS